MDCEITNLRTGEITILWGVNKDMVNGEWIFTKKGKTVFSFGIDSEYHFRVLSRRIVISYFLIFFLYFFTSLLFPECRGLSMITVISNAEPWKGVFYLCIIAITFLAGMVNAFWHRFKANQ